MPKNRTYYSGVTAHLDCAGVLENGSNEDIRRFKEEYWKQYRRQWNKAKRSGHQAISILLSEKEMRVIAEKARKQGLSPTGLVKHSALAQAGKSGNLGPVLIGKVREAVIRFATDLEEDLAQTGLPRDDFDRILSRIELFENEIERMLTD